MANASATARISENEESAVKKAKRKTFFEKKLEIMARIKQQHPY